jgi:hypothetical protein
MIRVHDRPSAEALETVTDFRREFYQFLTARADAVFELADAVLCSDGPVRSLAELSLVGEHRRGHGSLYAALDRGRLDVERLRAALAALPLPRAADGRLVLAVDVTCWLRPDAHTSPERILCHTYGRGKDQHNHDSRRPYSFVVALEPGRSSWTAPLDVVEGQGALDRWAHDLDEQVQDQASQRVTTKRRSSAWPGGHSRTPSRPRPSGRTLRRAAATPDARGSRLTPRGCR